MNALVDRNSLPALIEPPVQVVVAPEPFVPRAEHFEVNQGCNLGLILTTAVNLGHLAFEDLPRVQAFVNGRPLPGETPEERMAAFEFMPEAGDVVNLAVQVARGSTGRTIFQLFYTIGAAVVGYFFGPLWGSAILLAGAVTSNLLFPIKKPDRLEGLGDRGALSDQSNTFRRRGMMPLRLGRSRYAFDLASSAYSQLVGEDVWLHVIFGIHYGPCDVPLDQIKIGETLLADYDQADVQVELFTTPGPRTFTIYPNRVIQENLQDELVEGEFEVHTSADDAEFIEVDVTLPQGLSYTNEKGKILEQGVHGVVYFKPAGSGGGWTPAPLPPAVGPGGPLGAGSFYIQERTADPVRRTYRFAVPEKGQYDVGMEIAPRVRGEGQAVDAIYWTALRTIENQQPVVDETLACMALRIKSTNDLSGSLPLITGVVEPIVPVWNGSDWDTEAPSSNAAALARWLNTGPAAADPMLADEIDAGFGDQFERIAENEWLGAVDLTDEISLEDAMLQLGQLGRFRAYHNGQALVCVGDWDKPVPRQVFTARNVSNYRIHRTFQKPVHAVLVEFPNTDEDAKTDELWVYNDGYDKDTATEFETLRLTFACAPDRAFREGRVYLAKRKVQAEVHEWEAGVDSIASTYGDRVKVGHRVGLYGIGEARVDFRRMSGGLVTGLRLDDAFDFEAGQDYAMTVRRADQVLDEVDLVNPGVVTRDVTFPAPLTPDQAPDKGDLVAVGRLGIVTEDLELADVQPGKGRTCSLMAMRYSAVEIEAAETGPIPDIHTGLSGRKKAPKPRLLGINQQSPEGVVISFDVDPTRQAEVQGFTFKWRRSPDTALANPDFTALPPLGATARTARTPPIPEAQTVTPGEEYRVDLELRTVMTDGQVSEPLRVVNILVSRPVVTPLNFNAVGVKRVAEDGTSYPAIFVSADAMEGGSVQDMVVEIRQADDGATPQGEWVAGTILPALNPQGDVVGVAGGNLYDVRGRWRTADNWFGDWVYEMGVRVPAGSLTSNPTQDVLDQLLDFVNLGAELQAKIAATFLRQLEIARELEKLAESTIVDVEMHRRETINQVVATYLRDQPPGPIMVQEIARTDLSIQKLDLIGGLSDDGLGFVINQATFRWDNGTTVAEHIQQTAAAVGEAAAAFTELRVASSASETMAQVQASFVGQAAFGTYTATVANSINLLANENEALAEFQNLIGVMAPGGNAIYINGGTFRINDDESVIDRFDLTEARFGGTQTSFLLNTLTITANTADTAAEAIFTLGSMNGSNTAFVLDAASTFVSPVLSLANWMTGVNAIYGNATAYADQQFTVAGRPGYALAQTVNTIGIQFNGLDGGASWTDVREVIYDEGSGLIVRGGFALNNDGHVIGMLVGLDTEYGTISFATDVFQLIDADGVSEPPLTYGLDNWLYAPRLRVQHLVVGAAWEPDWTGESGYITTGPGGEVTLRSRTKTMSGGAGAVVMFRGYLNPATFTGVYGTQITTATLHLYRDGVEIGPAQPIGVAVLYDTGDDTYLTPGGNVVGIWFDQPDAGSHTYSVTVTADGPVVVGVGNGVLWLQDHVA